MLFVQPVGGQALGRSMKQVWVEYIAQPSGRFTTTGVVAGWMSMQGVLVIR